MKILIGILLLVALALAILVAGIVWLYFQVKWASQCPHCQSNSVEELEGSLYEDQGCKKCGTMFYSRI